MTITPEALEERGFYNRKNDEDEDWFLRNTAWGHYIKVSFFVNQSTLVQLCHYNEPFIPAFGCKTMEDIDQLVRLFIKY